MKRSLFLITALILTYQLFSQPFTEVAAQHNIDRGYGTGLFGGGVSFCDFNGDGWDDLSFATQAGDSLLFYINTNGVLTKIPALVSDTGQAEQILWADYDNDGDKDLFITFNEGPNKLYNNDGDLNLTDVTASAGLSTVARNSYGAIFGDYNNDGWLDLYVCNHFADDTNINELYKNEGNGHFQLTGWGVGAQNDQRPTFCAAFFDFNKDGFQDIYISNDRYLFNNALLKNKGDGTFQDISTPSGTDISIDAMNVGIGDYDNDGFQDIYVTNTPLGGNKLLRNKGDETFEELSEQCGVDFHKVGWGGNFLDFDNDGDLDLYVSSMNIGSDKPNSLYDNDGDGAFTEPWILEGDTVKSFANAVGDFNNDGKPDIVVINVDTFPFMLWENQVQNDAHWLKVKLEGTISNRDGIGTWLEVYTNGEKVIRYSHCGEAYLAQNSSNIHVGLGDYSTIDSIKVLWLSGIENWLYNVEADQTITITEEFIESTHDQHQKNNFSIFPNPATNLLNVEFSESLPFEQPYEILNSKGVIIKSGQIIRKEQLDLSQFSAGTYLFKLNNKVQPFVIIR